MPGSATAEIYFIAAMMFLIIIISVAAVYFFMRQYRKEKAEKMSKSDNLTDQSSAYDSTGESEI